jgi:hypothetical protein
MAAWKPFRYDDPSTFPPLTEDYLGSNDCSREVLVWDGNTIRIGYLIVDESEYRTTTPNAWWQQQGRDGYRISEITFWKPLPMRPRRQPRKKPAPV